MNEWQEYVKAERLLFDRRSALFGREHDLSEVLRGALQVISERDSALRLMLELEIDVCERLLGELVEIAGGGARDVGLARRAIARVRGEVLDVSLWSLINESLVDADYWVFRRQAELLSDLNRSADLARLVALATGHQDSDVREVADDFAAQ